MFSNKSLHILKKLILHVRLYGLLLPTSIKGLEIFLTVKKSLLQTSLIKEKTFLFVENFFDQAKFP